jgi:hypothetical protein
MHGHALPIRHGNTGRFLPPVLEGVQPKERHARCILVRSEDTDHAAFIVGMVINGRVHWSD